MSHSRIALAALPALFFLTSCSKAPETPTAAQAPAQSAAPLAASAPAPTPQAPPPPAPAAADPHAGHAMPSAAPAASPAAAPLVFPAPSPAKPAAPPANTRVAIFAGLEADIPLSWKPVTPANSMRLAEFEAPTAGQPAAEAVVFYFPPGQGGPKDMNIARWASQFTDGKGNPVKPVIADTFINNMAVTRIELNGSYSRGVGMGSDGNSKPNQTLLAAIVTTPVHGNVTFHFFGPQGSIKKQRDSFEAMLRSLRYKG